MEYKVRQWIGPAVFIYLGLATTAGVVGSIDESGQPGIPGAVRRQRSTGLGGLLTVLMMGLANMREQRIRGPAERAKVLDPNEAPGSGHDPSA